MFDAGGNTAHVDLSGWSMNWNGFTNIPSGSGAYGMSFTDGVANVVCALDCNVGDTCTLGYRATFRSMTRLVLLATSIG